MGKSILLSVGKASCKLAVLWKKKKKSGKKVPGNSIRYTRSSTWTRCETSKVPFNLSVTISLSVTPVLGLSDI